MHDSLHSATAHTVYRTTAQSALHSALRSLRHQQAYRARLHDGELQRRLLQLFIAPAKPSVFLQLLNKLQPLFASSTLFAKDPQQLADNAGGSKGGKPNRRRKWKEERVKMGQGGTLDPLADGVLGELLAYPVRLGLSSP